MRNPFRILGAELIGTCVLMIGGPGSAILAGDTIGHLGIALAFGFSLLAMGYAIGPISGCHINPAVTIALWFAKKVEGTKVGYYLVGQVLGAALGGLIIFAIAKGQDGFSAKNHFAANGWGTKGGTPFDLGAVALVEIVFTALLIFVVLTTFSKRMAPGAGGLTIGLTLTLIHLVTIPVDNTSVNPARSFGTAIFSGTDALSQLWAFIVFPILGAAVGVLTWVAVEEARLEDTVFMNESMARALDSVADKLDGDPDT
jgi:aquaporin Z